METTFEAIYIEKLFGSQDYEIQFKDRKLILAASNGNGKTTILRIIYHYLSGQWELLLPEELEAIAIVINGEKQARYVVKKENIQDAPINLTIQAKYKSKAALSQEVLELLFSYKVKKLQREGEAIVRKIAIEYDVLEPQLNNLLKNVLEEALTINTNSLPFSKVHYLFLPTYRRIEKDVEEVFPDFVDNLSNLLVSEIAYPEKGRGQDGATEEEESSIEIIKQIIQDYWRTINKSKKQVDQTADISYEELVGFGMEDIEQQINQVWQENSLQAKKQLEILLEKCNVFFELNDTELLYERGAMKVKRANSTYQHSLKKLSSGEKQVVALFTHLIFSKRPVFLFFDEPEISLSVSWQKNLIEVINSLENVSGFLFATHSGSIVMDEHSRSYFKGMDRFKIID